MRIRTIIPFAGSSLLLLGSTVTAQTQPSASDPSVVSVEEIIVTARRRSESLQDIPQTVDAVTADDIDKLSLQKFEDVQALVPGLTLSSGTTGFSTAASIRGASFQVESSARPTVEFYLNDAPIESVFLFQQMYDVGQIEVLRGPQGTLRGRSSPSGSITITTRRPELTEFGGYLDLLGTDEDSRTVQGAINIPLIEDKLGLRVAGLYDENDLDHVRSLTNPRDPSQESKSGRVSLLWEASDAITANLVYQYIERDQVAFDAYQSFSLLDPTAPVVQPTIRASDRRSILDGARTNSQEFDIVTGQFDWRFAGQKLSYVGTYSKLDLTGLTPLDLGNIVPNAEFSQTLKTESEQKASEVRLASEERLFNGLLDYTVGAFFQRFRSPSDLTNLTLIGVQSSPTTVTPLSLVPTPISRRSKTEEDSVFANLTFHVGEKTELSAGVRYLEVKSSSSLVVRGMLLSTTDDEEKPTIWNASGSYRFTDDFLVYANVGTSFRDGPLAVGVFRPPTPRITQFTNLDSEDSTTYEVGFKASFFDKRVRLNLSAFHQDYEDFIYRGPLVFFVDLTGAGPVPAQFNFLSNVDATVDGAELDVAYQATKNFNVSLGVAYADGEMDNGVVACNDFDGDGVPDRNVQRSPTVNQILAAAGSSDARVEAVASCKVNDRLSFAPDLTATVQAEYTYPVTTAMDVFGRALYTYNDDNEQDPNNRFDDVDAYGLLNLYGGLRSGDGSWEVSLFVRNALDTDEVLNRGNGATTTPFTTPPPTPMGMSLAGGFTTATFTPPRELGVSVRYAFGSR